jgi:hypothetical protein
MPRPCVILNIVIESQLIEPTKAKGNENLAAKWLTTLKH